MQNRGIVLKKLECTMCSTSTLRANMKANYIKMHRLSTDMQKKALSGDNERHAVSS